MSKPMIVTEGLVVTVCRVILLYEARVANSLLSKHRFVTARDPKKSSSWHHYLWGAIFP